MVLGTFEWRTELRAFLAFQASNRVTITALNEKIERYLSRKSRTFKQIHYCQLAAINKDPELVRQLTWFAAKLPMASLVSCSSQHLTGD